jgi:anti-sigma factor RsiW
MTHKPEPTAAAYLAGELSESERESFEDHLVECDECWAEVEAGRRGQIAVESVRELAPSHLRSAIRKSVSTDGSQRLPSRRRVLFAAAALVLVAGISAGTFAALNRPESTAVAAAIAGYTDDRLPGNAMPKGPAPDLSPLRMTQVGAGAGRIDDIPVTAYAYRDPAGRRLMIYTSTEAFPMPQRARPLDGREGPWMAHRDGIAVLCARDPHELLIVGEDDELVHDAAVAMDVM